MERIFFNYSDENHPLTIKKIQQLLSDNGYTATENTIREDIEALKIMGLDIINEKRKGYKLVNRLFDTVEVKIIADAVASFRFLTEKEVRRLMKKLSCLCSVQTANEIHREIHLSNRVRTRNTQVLINIDTINRAIKENKQFEFDYYDYNIDKEQVFNGRRTCSPWALAISQEQYYVVSYYEKHPDSYTNFRIDRMKNIKITDKKRIETPDEELELGSYLKSSFCMFSGKAIPVKLQFPLRNKMCNVVIDRFGYDVRLRKTDDNHFQVTVPIKAQQPIAFFSWLTMFGGEVRIMNSENLSDKFIEFIRCIDLVAM
jgi:predicted DNA-binding transcriptional regulator YafY